MAAGADPGWEHDRRRFVSRRNGASSRNTPLRVADDRNGIWSPLARQFADIGRELYTVGSVAEVWGRVVAATVRTVPGAAMASLTLRRTGGSLHTPCRTDESAVFLDELQELHGEGPFLDAVRPDGTGMASSSDLAQESSWPEFGSWAAESGVRSVMCTGMFPVTESRAGSLSVYSTEPRGLAAADPDVLLVLASFAAAALGDADVVTEQELRQLAMSTLLPSNNAVERATAFLRGRRHLSPGEAYDILRRSSANLIQSWHRGE